MKYLFAFSFLLSTVFSFAGDGDIEIFFCSGKGEGCTAIGHKTTWDIDDANKCQVLVVGNNLKGKKLSVKIFREGRAATKASIDDMFNVEIEGGKVCKVVPFKFERRGDYYVKIYDENNVEIASGHVDMEEDMF